jgi:signal transduction histidine kinase
MVMTRSSPKTTSTGPSDGRSSISGQPSPSRRPLVGWLVYLAFALGLLGLYAVVPGGDKAVVVVCIVASMTFLPLALVRLRTRDREARRRVDAMADRLAGLHQIDLAIISAEFPAQVVRGALSHLRSVVPCDRASVILYRPEDGVADFMGVDVDRDGLGAPSGATLPLEQFAPLDVLAAAGTVRTSDLRESPSPIFTADAAKRLVDDGIHALVTTPLFDGATLLGSLTASSLQVGGLTDAHERIIVEVASQVAIAVRQAQLREGLHAALEVERNAAERLRELDGLKNSFLTAVSHELRTPLTTLLGNSLTLERSRGDLTADVQDELIRGLSRNALKLQRLLEDLLDLDRLTRGVFEPMRSRVDVGALVRSVVMEVTGLRDRELYLDTPCVEADVDVAKVERIVENLATNAARYTDTHSRVWVRVEASDDGVLIVVEDEGLGVPEHLKQTIFQPFQQGERAIDYSPGVGIGLSITAQFAELHGGRAWVEDRPGGGASFKVWLRSDSGGSRGPRDVVDEPRSA